MGLALCYGFQSSDVPTEQITPEQMKVSDVFPMHHVQRKEIHVLNYRIKQRGTFHTHVGKV